MSTSKKTKSRQTINMAPDLVCSNSLSKATEVRHVAYELLLVQNNMIDELKIKCRWLKVQIVKNESYIKKEKITSFP